MTKENPSKKERIENARKETEKELARLRKKRKENQTPKEELPRTLGWLFKRKKNGN